MLVYSSHPKGYINIGEYVVPGYLEKADPVSVPYDLWLKRQEDLKPAVYTPLILKKLFGINTTIRFSTQSVKYLPFESLVELQQKIKFPLRNGRSLENYRNSLRHFLKDA